MDPKATMARVALAQMYVATGDQERGEDELILATKAEPENEGLLHVLGLFYRATCRFAEFEKLYLDLLKKKPDSIAKKRLCRIVPCKGTA